MARLHEVLGKHKASHKPDAETAKKEENKTRHVLLKSSDARTLFLDLPRDHKFWTVHGKEINNLTELYKSLIEMENEIFRHHVSSHKNDFAEWVHDILKDTVLARRLKTSTDKVKHVEIVKHRIDELKGGGVAIPTPHSKLKPNFGFIRVDRAHAPQPPMKHSKEGFSIRPQALKPDISFIQTYKNQEQGGSRYDSILENQESMIDGIRKENSMQESISSMVGELRNTIDNLSGQLNSMRSELVGLKEEVHRKRLVELQKDKEQMEELKDTVKSLREKEREMLGEIKVMSKTEEQMIKKSDLLIDKEKDLAEKENQVLKKEQHFNTLLKKYDEMLRGIHHKMDNDEKKIQTLLTGVERIERKEHLNPQLFKGVSQDDMAAALEVTDLIKSAKHHAQKGHDKHARHDIDRVKHILKTEKLSNSFKKSAYFQIFELATDLDLKNE